MIVPLDEKQVVLKFLGAITDGEYGRARTYVSPDLEFAGPLGTRSGADLYFADMERLRLRYEVKKVFHEGAEVCVLYDLRFSDPAVKIPACGIYSLNSEKIRSIRLLFDPRPLVEARSRAAGTGPTPGIPAVRPVPSP
jgi:SnoaL-like domain